MGSILYRKVETGDISCGGSSLSFYYTEFYTIVFCSFIHTFLFPSVIPLVTKNIIFNQVHMLNPLGRIVFFTSIDLQNNLIIIYNKSVTKSCCCPASTISLCSNISTANNLLIITVTNSLYLKRLNTIFANNKQTYSIVVQK